MLIRRSLENHLQELAKYFPVLSVTGPRQSGKTTLLRTHFPDYDYISLEDILTRETFAADPGGFLQKYNEKVIIDEAQHFPDLFSYLQVLVDEDRKPGRFVLSGSQNFLLNQHITQSLAGRVGIARLLPFDLSELSAAGRLPADPVEAIYQGGYPELYQSGIPPKFFFPNYVASYLERDVKGFVSPKNMLTFRKFMRLCAALTGQLVNYSSMATALGVSVGTIKEWLSILEMSYIIFQLPPYFKNFKKRMVKSTKLYFYDTGLACYFLNLTSKEKVAQYDGYGALFENLIVANRMRTLEHNGEYPQFYFYRDKDQTEVDILEDQGNSLRLTEVKANTAYTPRMNKTIEKVGKDSDVPVNLRVMYGGAEELNVADVEVLPWFESGRL